MGFFTSLIIVLLMNKSICAVPELTIVKIALEDPYGTGVGEGDYRSFLEIQDRVPLICIVSQAVECTEGAKFDILNKDTNEIIITKECQISESYDKSRKNSTSYQALHISQRNSSLIKALPSSRLQCRYHDGNGNVMTSDNTIRLPFVPCGGLIGSDWCANYQCPNPDEHTYCMETKTGVEQCAALNKMNLCENEFTHYRYCPVNEMGLCRAVVRNHTAVWLELKEEHECPNISNDVPPLKLNGKTYMYAEPVVLRGPSDIVLEFDCESGFSGADYTLSIGRIRFAPKAFYGKCDGQIRLTMKRTNETDAHTTGAFDTLLVFQVGKATFKHNIVIFDTSLNLSIDAGQLKCTFQKPVQYWSIGQNDFIGRSWWTKQSSGNLHLSEKAISNSIFLKESYWGMDHRDMSAHRTDTYRCHVRISYKTCMPYRELSDEIHSTQVEYLYNSASRLQPCMWIAIYALAN